MTVDEALKIAKQITNDEFDKFAETDKSFYFIYKNVIDNTLIKVEKATKEAKHYVITEHFDELEKLTYKELK